MARVHSGCQVWQQDFLELDLPDGYFDGIFANASLFHVPSQELPRVLLDHKARGLFLSVFLDEFGGGLALSSQFLFRGRRCRHPPKPDSFTPWWGVERSRVRAGILICSPVAG